MRKMQKNKKRKADGSSNHQTEKRERGEGDEIAESRN